MLAIALSLSALLVMVFVGPVLDALPGPFLPEAGLVALAIRWADQLVDVVALFVEKADVDLLST